MVMFLLYLSIFFYICIYIKSLDHSVIYNNNNNNNNNNNSNNNNTSLLYHQIVSD